jgi:predicted kinase
MGRLIHINGPPGAGKTSLATRYLDDHPLALVVDIDDLRTHLGQWDAHQESRLLARDLAIALVTCHLDAGHDVVVPQFLGRLEFIERLEATAERCGVLFIEVLLTVDPTVAADRFRSRRRELESLSAHHPERDIDESSIDEVVENASSQLAVIAAAHPAAMTVPVAASLDETYRTLMATLADHTN